MTDKELHKLKRQELLQMMLDSGREAEKLRRQMKETEEELNQSADICERLKNRLDDKDQQINKLKGRLDDKDRQINKLKSRLDKKDAQIADLRGMLEKKRRLSNLEFDQAGSIADAAIKINEVFDAAQKAADQYLYNVRRVYGGGYDLEASGREAEERVIRQIDAAIAADRKEAEEEAAAWAAREAEHARLDAEEAKKEAAYAAEERLTDSGSAKAADFTGTTAVSVEKAISESLVPAGDAAKTETASAGGTGSAEAEMASAGGAGSAEAETASAGGIGSAEAETASAGGIGSEQVEAVSAEDTASNEAAFDSKVSTEHVIPAAKAGDGDQAAGRPAGQESTARENVFAAAKAPVADGAARQGGIPVHRRTAGDSNLLDIDKTKKSYTGIELARMAAKRAEASRTAAAKRAEASRTAAAKRAEGSGTAAAKKAEASGNELKTAGISARQADITLDAAEPEEQTAESTAKPSGTQPGTAGSKAQAPESTATPSGTQPGTAGSKAQAPESTAKPSGTQPDTAGTETQAPESTVRPSGTQPGTAGSRRQAVGSGAKPAVPAARASASNARRSGFSDEEKARRVASIKEEIMRQMNASTGAEAKQGSVEN